MFTKKKPAKQPVTIDIVFQEKISRLFIFRFLWVIPLAIPLVVYSIWFSLLSVVQFLHMLLLGERSRPVFDSQLHFLRYAGGWQFYLRYHTNARPVILPWRG